MSTEGDARIEFEPRVAAGTHGTTVGPEKAACLSLPVGRHRSRTRITTVRFLVFLAGAAISLPGLTATKPPVPRLISVTLVVDSTDDTVDANPGNGICADANGHCTLRAAVMEANALAGADTISFDASTNGTPIVLTLHGAGEDAAATGDLDVSANNLTITGNGADSTIIDGDADDRVFEVVDHSLTLDQLRIQNGGNVAFGGGILVDGAATLNLSSTVVADNHASGSASVQGGGIKVNSGANFGALLSNITGNSAQSSGSSAYGGGISVNTANLVGISESQISGNTASSTTSVAAGAGLFTTGPLEVQDSIVRGNTAHSDQNSVYGGGIDVGNGSLTLSRVELSDNVADAPNGSPLGGGLASSYPTTLANTTVADNRADERGGGIDQNGGALTLVNVTIVGNQTAGRAAMSLESGATVDMADTLIADNTGSTPNCDDEAGAGGTVTSHGYNLIGDVTGCSITAVAGDQFGTASTPIAPRLSALMVTGGNGTRVFYPLLDSPALDAGDPVMQASGGTCTTPDQVGDNRPYDGDGDGTATCDIGAVERQADRAPVASDGTATTSQGKTTSSTLTATDADGDALTYAIAQPPAHGTVTLDNADTGAFTYMPNSGFSGADSFTFKANDSLADSNVATVDISVSAGDSGGGIFGPLTLLGLLLLRSRTRRRS